MTIEKKQISFAAELKAVSDDGNIGKITGYGSVFGVVDSYNEVCDKGCFVNSLTKRMPAMLWQHDQYSPIGVWTSAKEDQNGLMLEGEINLNVKTGHEAYELLKQGALKGLSIGFRTVDSIYDDANVRHLREVNLMEVSIVTFPANTEASVTSVKNELPDTEREFEKFLRDAGYSRSQAKAITARGFKTQEDEQRDVVDESVKSEVKNFLDTLNKSLNSLKG